ncbi:site-specific DNA-methyltransferase [bacterium]|nr:site-specific DNA-methyltransferase [bacterium]
MSTQYEKLLSLLKELFQTDQADLDFGMYRIINQRRDEINRFLDEDLLPQVEEAFTEYQSVDKKELEAELAEVIESAKKAGLDKPEESPNAIKIREQIANYSVDIDDLENQVYSALYNFFRRYYDNGDFVSQRRYKEGVYAIPYEGEEVKLYWANHDQYYIKTSEYLRDYSFKLHSGKNAHFRLVEADAEKDNRKETDDKKRRFILADDPLKFENGELTILFEFRPDEAKRNQTKINEETVETILGLREQIAEQDIKDALLALAAPAATESNKERSLFAKHLNDYTYRNTQDYFIHKDLGAFLRSELDFFIKNEIMQLDNIENESAPKVEQYLSKIKVIRKIAHKLIEFLAQFEDFQKKLWLKKKFVVETNYCITLDRIPVELYPEIAANDAQREEWVRLFAIDEINGKGDMFIQSYSEPLTVEFLHANPYLLVDTKYFDEDFKCEVFSENSDLDNSLDGAIFQSENFQALRLLISKYLNSIKSIYIDPPYNTSASEIIYKNNYKHSSWLSFLQSRLSIAVKLLRNNGMACVAIDDSEFHRLYALLISIFGDEENILGTVSIRVNPAGRATQSGFSLAHDYAIFAGNASEAIVGHLPKSQEQIARYSEKDEKGRYEWVNFRKHGGANANRTARPKLFYPIVIAEDKKFRIPRMGWDSKKNNYMMLENPKNSEKVVYPINSKGEEKTWKWGHETVLENMGELTIRLDQNQELGIYMKSRMQEGTLPRTIWTDKKYSATNYGTNLLADIMGQSNMFSFPKSVFTLEDSLRVLNLNENEFCLDFFAGSGTTAHALINLNRLDDIRRKYILVEMGQYFEMVLVPRIQKVIYSEDWKDGKPVSRHGVSHAFKYQKLESYEDTLNNLELLRTEDQEQALFGSDAFYEDYMLHYILDFESKGSLWDLKQFDTPFDYQLQIASSTVGETVPTKVDLVETFNYLIGLQVHRIRKIDGVVLVEGQTRDNKTVLVLWRNTNELDSDSLNAFFATHFSERQNEFDLIYVNGDNTLENTRPDGAHWKVQLTEKEFHYRMFEE